MFIYYFSLSCNLLLSYLLNEQTIFLIIDDIKNDSTIFIKLPSYTESNRKKQKESC